MKQTHKTELNSQASRQTITHQGAVYAVTITRCSQDDGTAQALTNKTFRLKDLPALLQAIEQIEGQHAALA